MEKEKKAQEVYMQLQMIEQYIKNLQKQLEMIEVQFIELNMTTQSIEEFKKLKGGTEMLVPLNSGIFMKAELKDMQDLILNVGSNIMVKKNPESAKELIEKQIREISSVREKIAEELDKLMHHAEAYHSKLQKLVDEESA